MQIPIYSKLKTKLESKGIDNISSGQIAWFVCSVIFTYLLFLLIVIINTRTISFENLKFFTFEGFFKSLAFIFANHFFLFIFMWIVCIINFFNIKNLIPITLNWIISYCYFVLEINIYFILILCITLCVVFYFLQKRLLYTFLFYFVYMVLTYTLFYLGGGFYK